MNININITAQYNNRLFEYPETIDKKRTLNKVLFYVQKRIKEYSTVVYPSTEWKFVRFLYYEITIFKFQSIIGYAVSLPLHFYQGSNEKNVVKFENLKDILCFWRCLAAYKNPDKKDYRLIEKASKQLYKDFYGKKYDEDYEGVKYLEYKKILSVDIDGSENEKEVDEIDSIEQHFKVNIDIYTKYEKDVTQIDRRSINNNDVLYL